MKKWLALYRIELISALTYRAEGLLWVCLDIFPALISMIVWFAVFRGQSTVGTYSLTQLIGYYMAAQLIMALTENHFDERWASYVRYGKIDTYFLKPAPMPYVILCQALARKTMSVVLFFIPFSVVFALLHSIGFIQIGPITPALIAVTLAVVLLSFFLSYFVTFFVVLMAFWIDEAASFGHFRWVLTGIFSGSLAPIAFYPQWMQKVSTYLPFQYTVSMPATLLTKYQIDLGVMIGLLTLFLYVVAFGFIAKVWWRRAALRYTSAGG